jgi:hypothetical protein
LGIARVAHEVALKAGHFVSSFRKSRVDVYIGLATSMATDPKDFRDLRLRTLDAGKQEYLKSGCCMALKQRRVERLL